VKSYDYYFDSINNQFTNAFGAIYKPKNKLARNKISPYLSEMHRRWYYSTIFENTFLSPANILESLNHEYDKNLENSATVHFAPTTNYTGLKYITHEYNQDTHPIIADFCLIIDFCNPHIDLTPTNQMPIELAIEAAKKLNLNNYNYASYLLELAMDMGLVVKIPSIHVNRAQVAEDAKEHLSIHPTILFDKIVKATLHYSSHKFNEFLPLPVPIFKEENLLQLLKSPLEIDQIFQNLYDMLGMDLEEAMDPHMFDDIVDEMDMAVLSGTYLLGILLDKFFLTPFGYYLRLIRPLYMIPFDIKAETKLLLETLNDNDLDEEDKSAAFYAPCSRYYLTDFGLRYLNVIPDTENHLHIQSILPFATVSGLFNDPPAKKADAKALLPGFKRGDFQVFTIRAKLYNDSQIWLNIEASDTTNLHRLFLELSYFLDVDKDHEYIFYQDKSESPFMAYTSPSSTRRSKKAKDTLLRDLSLKKGQVMVLNVADPGMSFSYNHNKWHLTITSVHQGTPGIVYPRVTNLSRFFEEYLDY